MQSGVYFIRNKVTGRYYVGSSIRIAKRLWQHRNDLSKRKHHNSHLQRSWFTHGADAFEFGVLEYTEMNVLIAREQAWLDEFKPNVYNAGPIAATPNLGRALTEENKARLRIALKGKNRRPMSPEHKLKLIAINTGKKASPETRAKMSAERKGRKCPKSQDAKANMKAIYAAKPKKILTASHREAIGKGHIGKVHSEEWRNNLIASLNLPEVRAKIAEGVRNHFAANPRKRKAVGV